MVDCFSWSRQVRRLLAVSVASAFLMSGCDRAMFVRVNARALDVQGRPLAGETIRVISKRHALWPRPAKGQDRITAIDLRKYGEVYETDPNGSFAFDAVNTEPASILDALIFDSLFPPCVKFLIMMPDRQPSAYGVTFVPGGDYREDRLTYQHFDLKTGRTLRPTYCDVSGGLDVAIHRPPQDPNNPWSTPRPSLHIRVLTQELRGN